MEKQFVTYEIALDLKNLGFNEECFGYYEPMKSWMMAGTKLNPEPHFHGCNWPSPDNEMYFMYVANHFGDRTSTVSNAYFTKAIKNISAPLWQQVIDWFREKQNICINIEPITFDDEPTYIFEIINLKNGMLLNDINSSFIDSSEALEQAILEALELIAQNRTK